MPTKSAQPKSPPLARFEYKVLASTTPPNADTLNQLGAESWELVSAGVGRANNWSYIFKRILPRQRD